MSEFRLPVCVSSDVSRSGETIRLKLPECARFDRLAIRSKGASDPFALWRREAA